MCCEVDDKEETQHHDGKIKKYTARDYECLTGDGSHYFCNHHHKDKNCPIHPQYQRRK